MKNLKISRFGFRPSKFHGALAFYLILGTLSLKKITKKCTNLILVVFKNCMKYLSNYETICAFPIANVQRRFLQNADRNLYLKYIKKCLKIVQCPRRNYWTMLWRKFVAKYIWQLSVAFFNVLFRWIKKLMQNPRKLWKFSDDWVYFDMICTLFNLKDVHCRHFKFL